MQIDNLGSAFNRLWSASLSTNFGDGLIKVAGPLLAAFLTREPVLISLIGAMGMLPWLLLAIPIGAFADRNDRRLILAAANLTRALVALAVAAAVATDHMTIIWLYVAIFIFGTCEVAADTTAQALIPQILEEKDLEKGNSRLNMAETVVQDFVGVPISGLLYAVAVALPFAIGSAGFVLAAIVILTIAATHTDHQPREDGTEHHTFVEDLKFGIAFLWGERDLRKLVLITTSIGVGYNIASSTTILFLLETLKMPESQFGLLMVIIGLGALAGSAATPRLSARFGRGPVMVTAIIGASIMFAVQGAATELWMYIAEGVVGVFLISQWNILLMSCYQVLIPKHLYGRVHGTRRTLVWGMAPVGAVIGGFIANYGLRWPYAIGGTASIVISVTFAGFIRNLANSTVRD